MSHYAAGTRFEHKVRDDLETNGYEVIRAAGSKGATKVDLAAFKPGQLLLVQVKRNGTLPPSEWDHLVEVAGWVGGVPLLAANGARGRGVAYTRLLGPKRRGARNQNVERFALDSIKQLRRGSTMISKRYTLRQEAAYLAQPADPLGRWNADQAKAAGAQKQLMVDRLLDHAGEVRSGEVPE